MPGFFPGADSAYFQIGDTAPFNPAGAWTFHARVLPLSRTGTIITKWGGTADRSFLLDYDASNTKFGILGTDNTGYGENSGPLLPLGVWSHVFAMFTGSGGSLQVWIDGKTGPGSAVGAANIKNSTLSPAIGARLDFSNPMTGYLEQIATWDTALSVQEMAAIVAGTSPAQVHTNALSGYWPLGSNLSSLVDDGNQTDWTRNGNSVLAGQLFLSQVVAAGPAVDAAASVMLPPFENIGVGLFAPDLLTFLNAPFLNAGVGLTAPVLMSDPLPPFVPPSLPPTLVPGAPVGPGVPLPPLSSGGLAGIRFYQGPPWRWVVTDLASSTLTFLDRLAAEAVVTYTLDKGATARLSVPADNPEVNILADDGDPFVSEGNRLLYGFRREGNSPLWVCRFAGRILLVEDSGLTEDARTTITAYDPWQLMYQRPMVRDTDGVAEFPDKAGFFSFDDTQVGVIALTFLRNTIIHQGELGVDIGDTVFAGMDPLITFPGTPYWGSPYQGVWSGRTKSVFETTTQIDTDTQQGLMVGEVFDLMVQTGAVDFLLTPIYDPVNRPGYTHELSIYNRAGVEATDAIFAWDKPGRNVTQINALQDGTKRANTIRYYAEQGGPPVGGGIPLSDGTSILKYGESWHEEFWPGRIEAAALAMAELQLELMKNGQYTVDVTPSPERAPFVFSEYWLGDTVPVYASNKLRQAITGFQRIYGIVLQIDENSYEQLPSLLVSPDSE